MTISVVLPVKYEPYLPRLQKHIRDCLEFAEPYEILVQKELGLSTAVLYGVKNSNGESLVIMDADGSHNPKYIRKMVSKLNSYDIIVGSRYVNGGGTEDHFVRQLISLLFCKFARTVLGLKINDTMSGFIAFKKDVFKHLNLRPFGYKFALEMMLKSKGKFKVYEVPVFFERRKMGYSKTGIIEGIRTLVFIFKLWLWRLWHES